jgi:hypothetical protein
MLRVLASAALLAALLAGCGPSRQGGYPSYDAVVSQYVPAGPYRGEILADGLPRPDGPDCACPRVRYDDDWVYYYHGRWIYWRHGYWYTYPHFYVYYWGGLPYVYSGPHYGIRQDGGNPGGADGALPAGPPALRAADRSPTRSAAPTPTPSRSTGRDDPPARSRADDGRRKR